MAFVTPPNIFSSPTLTATILNQMHLALVSQIGGRAFGASTYSISPGNLDSNNIAAAASFRNAQKAEPYNLFFMSSSSLTYLTANNPMIPDVLVYAPVGVDCTIISAGLCAMGNQASKVSAGVLPETLPTVTVYINGITGIDITFASDAYGPAVTTVQPSYINLNIQLRAGDWIIADYSNLLGWGSRNAATPTLSGVNLSFLCKTLHVR